MDDLPEKLRALYVAYGINYVQAAADTIESLRRQLAECERERDEWKVEFKAAYKRETNAEQQLATVTQQRDELAALNARMLVEYEAQMNERDELAAALKDHLALCAEWTDDELRKVNFRNSSMILNHRALLAKLGADKTGEK